MLDKEIDNSVPDQLGLGIVFQKADKTDWRVLYPTPDQA
jgi:hypothetical protein